ncbi:unnamed protein product [Echinostoma caproni]|uniref:ANK_REP_REGION domain-containing protein n=1 Tax=Echinostoma caproni TaxID=27848 RepID=A0A183AAD3_9TREM|nr:unnamed protein product [Echinostoma caproni]
MSDSRSSKSVKSIRTTHSDWTTEEYRSMAIKLASSGDVSRLDALVNLWAADQCPDARSSKRDPKSSLTAKRLLASVRDRKGRTLLHLAARFVHPDMIVYVTKCFSSLVNICPRDDESSVNRYLTLFTKRCFP